MKAIGLASYSRRSLPALAGILGVLGIHEDAAAGQDAVHFGDHRRHPAHVEVLAARTGLAGQALVDVALHRLFPETHVRRVDRELFGFGGDLHVGVGQHEFADVAVEREAVGAVAEGQHQHGRRTVDRIAGAHLLDAGLQEVLGLGGAATRLGLCRIEKIVPTEMLTSTLDDPSSGSNTSRYLPSGYWLGNRVELVHFLGGHAGQVAAPLVGADHDVVGDDVELLLRLALHVFLSSEPITPSSAPLLTTLEIALQAMTTSFSSEVKSPVAPAVRRCSSMMNWVRVVPVCMVGLRNV
jgi:hypothetical protein